MMFDRTVKRKFNGKNLEYGIFEGSSKVFFIKVGQDGNIYGYMDKYMSLAELVNEKYGFTCIVSSNPFDGTDSLEDAINLMDEMFSDYEIYYMGHSNGARLGALYAYKYDRIKAMVLSDSPLEDNDIDRINSGILKFKGRVTAVYGSEDPSYSRLYKLDKSIRKVIIPGEDHNYTGSMDDLYGLPFKYLFEREDSDDK